MLPWLRIWLAAVWITSVAGTVVVGGLSQGHYSWLTFAWALVFGLAIGLPASLLTWVRLRPEPAA